MQEINFIRPQEVYNRSTGESKVRYRSYDGSNRFIPVVDGEDGVPRTLVVTTHAELVTMRDGGKLTAGALYRINDYECTTTQADTHSAGHPFDIVVMALSSDTLSERAWAMPHAGDEYFGESKLEAWQLWYCLDNDTDRFAWADAENGKGVVWRMIDEHNNDCPYDFKNIKFKRALTDGEYDPDEGEDVWCYTFTWIDEDGEAVDASVFCQNIVGDEGFVYGVHDNSMLPCIEYDFYPEEHSDKLAFALNDNVFISSYQFEDGVFYGIYGNHFGTSCYSNTFGNGCNSNSFGNDNYQNSFGNNCGDNSFGNGCNRNTFGNYCSRNTFGNNCYGNTFGNYCYSNTFGNDCGFNKFGNSCSSNTFGNECNSNSFGNECYNNSFGNYFQNNSFGNNFLSSSIGANVNNIKVNKDYVQFILIENGNQFITITSTATTSDTFRLENFAIALGVNNGGSMKTISHNTTNDTFKTTYQNSNSTTKNV